MQQDNYETPYPKDGAMTIFGIRLNEMSGQYLRNIATWTILTGTMGFLILTISLINTFQNLLLLLKYKLNEGSFITILVSFGYLGMNFLLNFFLLRVGILIKRALSWQSQQDFSRGLVALRNYIRVLGGYLIIIMVFVAISFVLLLFNFR